MHMHLYKVCKSACGSANIGQLLQPVTVTPDVVRSLHGYILWPPPTWAFCILYSLVGKVLVECIKAGDVNECPWPHLDRGEVGSTPGDSTSGQQVTVLGPPLWRGHGGSCWELGWSRPCHCVLQKHSTIKILALAQKEWISLSLFLTLISTLKCHANLYMQGLIILSTLSTHLPGYSLLFFNPCKQANSSEHVLLLYNDVVFKWSE